MITIQSKDRPMTGREWIRQAHRWVSITFTLVSAAIFLALGMGQAPAQWVYYLPLAPLALLVLTGLFMFFTPYVMRLRRRTALTANGRGS
jgi:ABC-type polysaccharide/polyol phosphate export permease